MIEPQLLIYGVLFIMENWKEVTGYNGMYLVSDLGNVISLFKSERRELTKTLNHKGYYRVALSMNSKMRRVFIHRLVVQEFLNHHTYNSMDLVIDHINEIKTDNRLENLRLITNRENCSRSKKNKTSQYTGVTWHKQRNKWVANIRNGREVIYLGIFIREIDAANAYKTKLNELQIQTNDGSL